MVKLIRIRSVGGAAVGDVGAVTAGAWSRRCNQRYAGSRGYDELRGRGHERRSERHEGTTNHDRRGATAACAEHHDELADGERHGGRALQPDTDRYGWRLEKHRFRHL